MGEVYRARDTKLGRDVAIKVLPQEFARNPERLARFEREAQVLAALNHPNIAAIYGLEQAGDTPYLVLEYVPGETLRGPLPVEEALGLARQMAAALEAAHDKAIMHRDLKPANVKVTPEGKVKVLDFGLAKAFAGEAPKTPKRILHAGSQAIYSAPGYLLFVREGTLLAQRFDVDRLQTSGEPVAVAEDIGASNPTSLKLFSSSANGVLTYRTGAALVTQLAWFDRAGKPLGTIGPPAAYSTPRLSPDQKRLAVERADPQTGAPDLWIFDLLRGASSRFTFDPANDAFPVWSPDGTRIAFASGRDGTMNVYQKLSSGAGAEEPLLKSGEPRYPTDWSPDGRFLLYTTQQWAVTCGCCRSPEIASPSRFSRRRSLRIGRASRRTGDGSPTSPTRRDDTRCTSSPSGMVPGRGAPGSGRSRPTEGSTHSGGGTGRSCSTRRPTAASWRWR